jgi:hypothetical protein
MATGAAASVASPPPPVAQPIAEVSDDTDAAEFTRLGVDERLTVRLLTSGVAATMQHARLSVQWARQMLHRSL